MSGFDLMPENLETQSFVKELFDAVRTKTYLNVPIDFNDDVTASTDINKHAETGTPQRAASPEVSPKEKSVEVESTQNPVLAESNEADTSESSATETISKSVRPRIMAPKVEDGEKEQVIVSSPIRRQLQRLKVRQGSKRRMTDENSDEEKSRYLVQVKHSRSRSRSPIRYNFKLTIIFYFYVLGKLESVMIAAIVLAHLVNLHVMIMKVGSFIFRLILFQEQIVIFACFKCGTLINVIYLNIILLAERTVSWNRLTFTSTLLN